MLNQIINPLLVKDVGLWKYSILSPEDYERYLRTIGVASCTALALHFPRAKVAVLVHIRANESLEKKINPPSQ